MENFQNVLKNAAIDLKSSSDARDRAEGNDFDSHMVRNDSKLNGESYDSLGDFDVSDVHLSKNNNWVESTHKSEMIGDRDPAQTAPIGGRDSGSHSESSNTSTSDGKFSFTWEYL